MSGMQILIIFIVTQNYNFGDKNEYLGDFMLFF